MCPNRIFLAVARSFHGNVATVFLSPNMPASVYLCLYLIAHVMDESEIARVGPQVTADFREVLIAPHFGLANVDILSSWQRMPKPGWNWLLWAGFALSVTAF
jgi:hypothetical protein